MENKKYYEELYKALEEKPMCFKSTTQNFIFLIKRNWLILSKDNEQRTVYNIVGINITDYHFELDVIDPTSKEYENMTLIFRVEKSKKIDSSGKPIYIISFINSIRDYFLEIIK